jgi:hypothetical protein
MPMKHTFVVGLVLLALTSCGGTVANESVAQPASAPAANAAASPDASAPLTLVLGSKQAGDLKVTLFSAPAQPIRGDDSLKVSVTDANGQPITDATVTFDIDMTNMSHGKNVVTASSSGDGSYSGKVFFLMPGPWRVIVGVQRAGQQSTVRFDFNVNFR